MEKLESLVLKYGEHSWIHVAEEMSSNGDFQTKWLCMETWATRQVHTDGGWFFQELDRLMKEAGQIQ
jgi:hypothetical protein